MCLHPYRVDARVRTPAAGQLPQLFVDVDLFVVEDLCAGTSRKIEPVREPIDRDYPLGAEEKRGLDRELPHRAGAPHGDDIAGLYVAILGRHVAGRENVGQEQDLFVFQVVGHLDRADIGEGYSCVFRLTSGIAAEHVRIPEEAAR